MAAAALAEVLRRADVWRGASLAAAPPGIPSGHAVLDAQLPGAGWPPGELIELLPQRFASVELALLRPALQALSHGQGWLALIAPPLLPYAPAWQQAGVDLSRLLVIRGSARDAAWCCEQILASGAFAATLAWLPQADAAMLRRLQLAHAGHAGLAVMLRHPASRHQASPAPLRLGLAAEAGCLRIDIHKRRGAPLPAPLYLPLGASVAGGAVAPAAVSDSIATVTA